MYHKVSIKNLSSNQISKLLNGHPVRINVGAGLQIDLSGEQYKKLHKAHTKGGKATTVRFDPFQIARHQTLRGQGIMSQAKKAFKNLGQHVKRNKEAYRPLATALKQRANEEIANASMYALDQGIDPSLVSAYSSMAHESLAPQGGSLKSFSKGLSHFVKTPAMRTVRKALRPLGEMALNNAMDLASMGLDQANQQAISGLSGMGLKERINKAKGGSLKSFSKGLSHFVKTPAMRTVRKTFKPLGQMALNDAMDLATMGLDQANQQAISGLSGMGLKKRRGRPNGKRRGGALYPAGY